MAYNVIGNQSDLHDEGSDLEEAEMVRNTAKAGVILTPPQELGDFITKEAWCTSAESRKHMVVQLLQLAVASIICASFGVFSDGGYQRQYWGHLLTAWVVHWIGAAGLCCSKWNVEQRCLFEGRLFVFMGLMWLACAVFFKMFWLTDQSELNSLPLLSYMFSVRYEGLHTYMFSLTGLCGAVLLKVCRNSTFADLGHFVYIVLGTSNVLFIYAHDQNNDIGWLMHWFCAIWMGIACTIRATGGNKYLKEFGASSIISSYLVFGGQSGLTDAATSAGPHNHTAAGPHNHHTQHSSVGYVMAWLAYSVISILLYINIF